MTAYWLQFICASADLRLVCVGIEAKIAPVEHKC